MVESGSGSRPLLYVRIRPKKERIRILYVQIRAKRKESVFYAWIKLKKDILIRNTCTCLLQQYFIADAGQFV